MDSTPIRLRQFFTVGEKRKRKTSAVVGTDLIVGVNNFSVLDASGKVVNRIIFREPMLVEGSKTSLMYAAIAERLPGSLFDGSSLLALKVKHCVMDRGIAVGVAQYMSGQWRRS
eukprot:3833521-Amphidinium_carterae.1